MSPLAMVVGATRLADNTAQGACIDVLFGYVVTAAGLAGSTP
jgi:hypothetical protein